jgi:hypothetical protein
MKKISETLRRIYIPVSLIAIAYLYYSKYTAKNYFDEINVRRINIVDSIGKTRIVISSPEKFPNPIINGKEYPRSINPAGLVFYNNQGNECGGIALVNVESGEQAMTIFDYSNSEAIGFGKYESKDGSYFEAGISILDRIPLNADMDKVGSMGQERVSISNSNKNASIKLLDPTGKERILLSVDSTGAPLFQILDTAGKIIFNPLHNLK